MTRQVPLPTQALNFHGGHTTIAFQQLPETLSRDVCANAIKVEGASINYDRVSCYYWYNSLPQANAT